MDANHSITKSGAGGVGEIVLKLILILCIWSSLSLTNAIPKAVQFKPVWKIHDAIAYVRSGQWTKERFYKKASKQEFSKDCYKKYINNMESNANLMSSDIACASLYDNTLYINNNDIMFFIEHDNAYTVEVIGEIDLSSFVTVEKIFFAIGNTGFSLINTNKLWMYEIAYSDIYQEMDFDVVADRLYSLLVKQEKKKLSQEEFASLVYYVKRGVLLAWEDGIAWFADDLSDSSKVTIYTQDGEGQRKEIFSYNDDYHGLGTGRFVADSMLFYCTGNQLQMYYLDGTNHLYVPADEWGSPVDALNYSYVSDSGTYWVAYIDGSNLYCLNYSDMQQRTAALVGVEEGKTLSGLFAMENYFYVTYAEDEGSCHYYRVE